MTKWLVPEGRKTCQVTIIITRWLEPGLRALKNIVISIKYEVPLLKCLRWYADKVCVPSVGH